MRLLRCIQCQELGHIKCTAEKESAKIKISARVLDDLNEFVDQKFKEALELDDSSDNIDAFDYVKSKEKHKNKKLTKT